jgi:probable addiction module antidote protein
LCGRTVEGEDAMSKPRKFDPANYLDDEKAVAAYVRDALETGDVGFIADALGVAARARGMANIAQATGLSRESLYRALSADGNPRFATVLTVMAALGIKLSAEPV